MQIFFFSFCKKLDLIDAQDLKKVQRVDFPKILRATVLQSTDFEDFV